MCLMPSTLSLQLCERSYVTMLRMLCRSTARKIELKPSDDDLQCLQSESISLASSLVLVCSCVWYRNHTVANGLHNFMEQNQMVRKCKSSDSRSFPFPPPPHYQYKQWYSLHLPPAAPDLVIFHHIRTCIHAIRVSRAMKGQTSQA